jgi:hypothetical protein
MLKRKIIKNTRSQLCDLDSLEKSFRSIYLTVLLKKYSNIEDYKRSHYPMAITRVLNVNPTSILCSP